MTDVVNFPTAGQAAVAKTRDELLQLMTLMQHARGELALLQSNLAVLGHRMEIDGDPDAGKVLDYAMQCGRIWEMLR